MELLAEFKKQLKEIQKIRKKSVQITRNEFIKLQEFYNKYYLTFTTSDLSFDELKREFPIFYSWFPRFKELIECYEKKTIRVNKIAILYDMVKNVLNEFQNEISKYQMIIDVCDDDKIKSPIPDFDYLIASLELAGLSLEDSCKIFGMFCNYCGNYVKKHSEYQLKSSDSITFLGLNAFDKNGNYKSINNTLVDYALSKIFKDLIDSSGNDLKDSYINMCDSFIELSHMVTQEDVNESTLPKTKNTIQTVSTPLVREPLEELKKYYRNYELVSIPKDLDSFKDLLDRCNIDDNEKRYILNLVSEASIKKSEPIILKQLTNDELSIYLSATKLLESLNYSNEDYYKIVQIIDDIKVCGELLEEYDNNDYDNYISFRIAETLIYAQLDGLFYELKKILKKYNNEKISDNTILYLLDENEVPYAKLDSDQIDGSFYKMVCNGIKKIRKDNQSSFRLVLTTENVSYRIYDIMSAKIHLSFIEIDSGIYLLVGVDVIGHGYENIVRRVIYHEEDIKKIERLVKDEQTRNNVLSQHEQYINLFNPNEKAISRKRENPNSSN